MSISSYANVYVEYPASYDVELDYGYCEVSFDRVEDGMRELEFSLYDCYSNELLLPVIRAFDKPLDEVRGLTVALTYETDEEEFFRCELTLQNGKWDYKESEIRMVSKGMDECPVEIVEE